MRCPSSDMVFGVFPAFQLETLTWFTCWSITPTIPSEKCRLNPIQVMGHLLFIFWFQCSSGVMTWGSCQALMLAGVTVYLGPLIFRVIFYVQSYQSIIQTSLFKHSQKGCFCSLSGLHKGEKGTWESFLFAIRRNADGRHLWTKPIQAEQFALQMWSSFQVFFW